MFRGRAQLVRFEPKDGLKVIAGGQISVFERDGQYQLYVDQLIPEGVGELSLAFAQLKDKLAAEGLFDEDRKRPLPILPKAVGIVTSPTGAAVRDIITVAKRRHPGVQLILFPVQVQGPEAPGQIVRGIEVLNNLHLTDVIIVGRGGGSIEELWAFNDENVVRAIAASALPVVSAVGHQTDYTLADFRRRPAGGHAFAGGRAGRARCP
jgi:exodeoxyribonuclease VII large subunit